MLDISVAGKWKSLRLVKKKKNPDLILGWIYKVNGVLAMLIEIHNDKVVMMTKDKIHFEAQKKDLKLVVSY